jgi:hypothetical protein
VKDGHLPIHWRLSPLDSCSNAAAEDSRQQKRHRYYFSHEGLSYRTQELFFIVFLTRYIDMFFGWKTLYVFIMKIVFISLTGYTIYLMKVITATCSSKSHIV